MSSSTPLLSVVIPTRNNIPYLSQCITSLLASIQDLSAEIIVVSNGSEADKIITLGYISAVQKCTPVLIKGFHVDTPGFVPAVNTGLKMTRGQYICILNDDTILSQNWFKAILNAKKKAEEAFPEITWGYFGPMSNCVKGIQQIDGNRIPATTSPAMVNAAANQLEKAASLDFMPCGDISGFCLLFTRKVYEKLGGLEAFGKGGWDDNDYCIRAQEAGFAGLVAPRSFVFHFGHVTLQRDVPENPFGVKDIIPFMQKWFKPTKKTLCVAYCVKIDTEADWTIFQTSLHRMKELADYCVILDDRSSVDIGSRLVEKFGGWVQEYHRNPDEFERNESRDRNKVLELARSTNAAWIWMLDHDEWPDCRLTPERLQTLLNPLNPQILYYRMPLATFWRGTTKIRVDGVWGPMSHIGLFRNLKAWGDIHPLGESKIHSRRTPTCMPQEALGITFVCNIEHYGYWTYENAVQKQNYYNETDKVKNVELIGGQNYNHIGDEKELHLIPFQTPTTTLLYLHKNEPEDLARRLWQYGTMFHEVIVVDSGSTFDVRSMCESFKIPYYEYEYPNYKDPDEVFPDYADARNFAVSKCNTDYILFMDPDEEFDLQSIFLFDKLLLEGGDAYLLSINNLNRDSLGRNISYRTYQPRLFRKDPRIYYSDRVHETLEKALENFKGVIALESPIVVNHYGFLKTTPEQRKAKNAKYARLLEKMLEEDPESYRAHFAYGVHLRDIGEEDAGYLHLLKAFELRPNFWNARWELALMNCQEALKLITSSPEESRPHDERWNAATNLVKDLVKWFPEEAAKLQKK